MVRKKHSDPSNDLTQEEAGRYFISTLDNVKAASVNEEELYDKYISVDEIFRKLIINLNNTEEYFSGLFVLRSHASFLSAGYLALSGQLADSYALQRSSLESALYGLYVRGDSEKAEVWLNRNEGDGRKKARNLFTYNKVLKYLKEEDSHLAVIVDDLYNHTIDYGSHPNLASIMSNISIKEKPNEASFKLNYFNVGNDAHKLCIKRISQVGIASLDIFNNIWKKRYAIVGLDKDLEQIKRGL